MERVPEHISFPEAEKVVLDRWEACDAFQESLRRSKGKPLFSFYDGPPFATGTPHYGHLLAGTIKDTVTRYAHQTGHHVERRFGWDCHGLPIEFEIEKAEGIKTRQDVLDMGIDVYNEKCRGIVMRYSSEWRETVTRLGRWIDFDNDYKTMDASFMESVWWVFSQLWEKGLVYRGVKVMPFSTGCHTPLSNFEANMPDVYKSVEDPAVYVAFPLAGVDNTYMVAWTTTPWTLPSNLSLAVNPELTYVLVRDTKTGKQLYLLEKRLPALYPPKKKGKKKKKKTSGPVEPEVAPYEVLQTLPGAQLVGKAYEPLFPYFSEWKQHGAFTVLAADWVLDDSGTGIVHSAPGFGESDFDACTAAGIIDKKRTPPSPVDDNGNFEAVVTDFAGRYVKEADGDIVSALTSRGLILKAERIHHQYPFCWRSGTPLLYKAVPCWFIAVEQMRDRMLEHNATTLWVPDNVKEGRFHNWVKGACDWCVSRNRFWGTPMPVWENAEGQRICIGSVSQLKELSGVEVTDLHRHHVDSIVINHPEFGEMHRVDEVFDCWFESGSMPYAQQHYPFENKDLFEQSFPANFIAEGLDQTRGWFYTLLVLSTALFDKPPFRNLIVNGIVLNQDGEKMSKSKRNYPPVSRIFDAFGADALRLCLISSPVVRAESLKFSEDGVKAIIQRVHLPWYNSYRFFVGVALEWQQAHDDTAFTYNADAAHSSDNLMDRWILSYMQSLVKFVGEEMAAYRLYTVVPRLLSFSEQLTNWYIRLNRKRFKGRGDASSEGDRLAALNTLFSVLLTLSRLMSPFAPFLSDLTYHNLRMALPEDQREPTVHFLDIPEVNEALIDAEVEVNVAQMQDVVVLARAARDRRTTPLKIPLRRMHAVMPPGKAMRDDMVDVLLSYIRSELNVGECLMSTRSEDFVRLVARLDRGRVGRRLRGDCGAADAVVCALDHAGVSKAVADGSLVVNVGDKAYELSAADLVVTREFQGDKDAMEASWNDSVLVVLEMEVDDEARREASLKTMCNRVQKLRKECGVVPTDPIQVYASFDVEAMQTLATEKVEVICSLIDKPFHVVASAPDGNVVGTKTTALGDGEGEITMWIVMGE